MNLIYNIHKENRDENEKVIAFYTEINPAAEFEFRDDATSLSGKPLPHLFAFYGNEHVNKEAFIKLENLLRR